MTWTVLAQGTPEEFQTALPSIENLLSGTPVKLEINTYPYPIAPIADLWGMEWVVERLAGSGMDITEVQSDGWYEVDVYGVTHTPVTLIIIAIAAVLLTAGIWGIVREIRLSADLSGDGPFGDLATIIKWGAIGAIGVLALVLVSRASKGRT